MNPQQRVVTALHLQATGMIQTNVMPSEQPSSSTSLTSTVNFPSIFPSDAAAVMSPLAAGTPSSTHEQPRSVTKPRPKSQPHMQIDVECGPHSGVMHLERFCGVKSKALCILYNGQWMAPKDFAALNDKKNWKEYIRHGGRTLKSLETKERLILDMTSATRCKGCSCPECCPNLKKNKAFSTKGKNSGLPFQKKRPPQPRPAKPLVSASDSSTDQKPPATTSGLSDISAIADQSAADMSTSLNQSAINDVVNVTTSCGDCSDYGVFEKTEMEMCSSRHEADGSSQRELFEDGVLYFTAEDIDESKLRLAISDKFPGFTGFTWRWPNEQFLIYSDKLPYYLLDLSRALSDVNDVDLKRARHLIYNVQKTDIRDYDRLVQLADGLSLNRTQFFDAIKEKLDALNRKQQGCVHVGKSPEDNVVIYLRLSKLPVSEPLTLPIQKEIFVWRRGTKLSSSRRRSDVGIELARLTSWLTRHLSYGAVWKRPRPWTDGSDPRHVASTVLRLRNVLEFDPPTADAAHSRNILAFVDPRRSAVGGPFSMFVSEVRLFVRMLVDEARSSPGTCGLFVVVGVGADVGLLSLESALDGECLERLRAAFLGVDVDVESPTCAVLHFDVTSKDTCARLSS